MLLDDTKSCYKTHTYTHTRTKMSYIEETNNMFLMLNSRGCVSHHHHYDESFLNSESSQEL